MPLGISRLVLSTSAIRRFFAADAVDADYLLTQSEDFLITERGELILGNQSDFVSGDFTDPDFSGLLTEAGQVLITQNDRVIGTEQLFETASIAVENNFITQDRQVLITQDGLVLTTEIETDFNLLETQNGNSIITQDLNNLAL